MQRTWQPTDNQVVQLLVNRGHLTQEQVRAAAHRQVIDDVPSLLQVLDDEGLIEPSLVRRVIKEAREDVLVRQLMLAQGVLTSRQLSEVTLKQRGTDRTLMQTLVQEALGCRAMARDRLPTLAHCH